jgi:hypothetical protein
MNALAITCVFCNRRDVFSGQFRSLDKTVVDLGSEFQVVPSPDKSSVDSPPAKAACRYALLKK